MSIGFTIQENDWHLLEKKIADYPGNVECAINNYLHGEGAELITQGVTKYIPVSTDYIQVQGKQYKRKKTGTHARDAKWYQTNKFNLAINITNIRDYYYLYFVQNGLGTSERTGGVPFADKGIDSVYAKVLEGIHEALNKEV